MTVRNTVQVRTPPASTRMMIGRTRRYSLTSRERARKRAPARNTRASSEASAWILFCSPVSVKRASAMGEDVDLVPAGEIERRTGRQEVETLGRQFGPSLPPPHHVALG